MDLISAHGGGVLVSRSDGNELSREVADMARSHDRLAQLHKAAAQDGVPFTDEAMSDTGPR